MNGRRKENEKEIIGHRISDYPDYWKLNSCGPRKGIKGGKPARKSHDVASHGRFRFPARTHDLHDAANVEHGSDDVTDDAVRKNRPEDDEAHGRDYGRHVNDDEGNTRGGRDDGKTARNGYEGYEQNDKDDVGDDGENGRNDDSTVSMKVTWAWVGRIFRLLKDISDE